MAPSHPASTMIGQAQAQADRALRLLVQQTVVSGTARRAILLHMDQLPSALAKPHHQRLARNAVMQLADRDHAQSFELPGGRLAIVWRSRSPDEVNGAMAALEHLVADPTPGQSVKLGQLISLFDLPAQAPWLLDLLTDVEPGRPRVEGGIRLDTMLLARLEEGLAQADLAQFLRWRPVMDIDRPSPSLAWDERTLSSVDMATCLAPGRQLDEGTWLFHRLCRSVDLRLLATMTGSRDMAADRPFALAIGVASILSPAFLAFDAALPAGLRGRVVLRLQAADILADTASYSFARHFAQGRGYRLLLRDASPDPDQRGVTDPARRAAAASIGDLLDHDAAGLDYIELRLTPELQAEPGRLPDRTKLVLDGVDDPAQLAWARSQGCLFAKGHALH